MCLKVCTSAMSLIVCTLILLWLIRTLDASAIQPLQASHSFHKVGHLADDISFAKLSATVDLSVMLRSVTKAQATIAKLHPKATSPFAAAFQLEGSEALGPASARLKTLHNILFAGQPRSRRGLAGVAAIGLASYAIYDVESLRGDVNNVIQQQHVIHHALQTASAQLVAAVNRRAINSILSNVTELHSFVAIQALSMTTTMYCLEACEHRIDPALVLLAHLNTGFHEMSAEALRLGLTPVIAEAGEALSRIVVIVPQAALRDGPPPALAVLGQAGVILGLEQMTDWSADLAAMAANGLKYIAVDGPAMARSAKAQKGDPTRLKSVLGARGIELIAANIENRMQLDAVNTLVPDLLAGPGLGEATVTDISA